jgi:glycosyltransferase involved in cell wall biosynthesis
VSFKDNDYTSADESISIYLGQNETNIDEKSLIAIFEKDTFLSYYFPIFPKNYLSKEKIFLVVATEWFSKNGGVSTFNRDLCIALAKAKQNVHCLVLDASNEEKKSANDFGVKLIEADKSVNSDTRERFFIKPELDFTPDVLIGHDIITGKYSKLYKNNYFKDAFHILFIHTNPQEIEYFKAQNENETASAKGSKKNISQRELIQSANLVVGVGSRLYRNAEKIISALVKNKPDIYQFNPILNPKIDIIPPNSTYSVLCLGRAEDFELKGLDIASYAMGKYIDNNNNSKKVELWVRGAKSKDGDNLKTKLEKCSNSKKLKIITEEYTSQIKEIEINLKQSSLFLMPSRAEGFGLVGLEAISFGVPVLISKESGLGELLIEVLGDEKAKDYVIDTQGEIEEIAKRWEREIDFKLRDREASLKKAKELKEELREFLSEENIIKDFLAKISL